MTESNAEQVRDSIEEFEDLLGSVANQIIWSEDLGFLQKENRIGKYRLKGLLGVGGQGICFLADDDDLQRTVVLKLYREGLAIARKNQILQEGRALAKIRSPHVAKCFAAESFDERPYLVLEFIEGQTLSEWAESRKIDSDTALHIAQQIAAGLKCVHDNDLLHLDLKPDNVILGGQENAVLIDFGLSVNSVESNGNRVAGSPSFLAPERVNSDPADRRVDVYGVGAILYFLLTQKAPIEGSSKSNVLDKLSSQPVDFAILSEVGASERAIEVCKRCLAMDPDDRFQSVDELIDFLNPKQKQNRKPVIGRIGMAAAAALIVVFALGYLFQSILPSEGSAKPFNVLSANTFSAPIEKERHILTQWLNGVTEGIELANDIDVEYEIKGPHADDSWTPLEDSLQSFVRLEKDQFYPLRGKASQSCCFTLFSFQFSNELDSSDSPKLEVIDDVQKRIEKNQYYQFTLEPDSLPPPGKLEIIYIMATTDEFDARALAARINDGSEGESLQVFDRLEPFTSGVRRGIRSRDDKVQCSGALIPYLVFDGSIERIND